MNTAGLTGAGPVTKRTLVSLSHALEAAALAAVGDGPLVVVALFQRLPYFERERAAYSELAERADIVVVGFVDDLRPLLPGRIHPILLDAGEPLTREWTVLVATPTMGAFLVAVDEETAVDGEQTLEAGRLFSGRWGFSTDTTHAELTRLRDQIATRGGLRDRLAVTGVDGLPVAAWGPPPPGRPPPPAPPRGGAPAG